MSKVEIELDDSLLALVDERAAATEKARSDVIADVLRREFGGSRLRRILDAARAVEGLPEAEASEVAHIELRAHRQERAARDSA